MEKLVFHFIGRIGKEDRSMNFDEKIEDKLLAFFDQESGNQKSIQGELYQKYYGIMHEEHGNGSGNWDSDKCELNKKGYSVEYLTNLVQKYLDDNPDEFMARLQLRVDSERIIFDRAYDNALEFIEKSIFGWIYQNPDLIDLKGKSLGKSVKEILDDINTE